MKNLDVFEISDVLLVLSFASLLDQCWENVSHVVVGGLRDAGETDDSIGVAILDAFFRMSVHFINVVHQDYANDLIDQFSG